MLCNQTKAVHSGEVNNNNNNSGEVQQSLSRGERCRAVIRANLDAYFGATDDAVRLTSDLLGATLVVDDEDEDEEEEANSDCRDVQETLTYFSLAKEAASFLGVCFDTSICATHVPSAVRPGNFPLADLPP